MPRPGNQKPSWGKQKNLDRTSSRTTPQKAYTDAQDHTLGQTQKIPIHTVPHPSKYPHQSRDHHHHPGKWSHPQVQLVNHQETVQSLDPLKGSSSPQRQVADNFFHFFCTTLERNILTHATNIIKITDKFTHQFVSCLLSHPNTFGSFSSSVVFLILWNSSICTTVTSLLPVLCFNRLWKGTNVVS